MNEKLSNIFEEISHVKKFHKKLGDFCQLLKQNVVEGEVDYATGNVAVTPAFKQEVDRVTTKSLQSLQQFEVFFTQLESSPAMRQTIKSETSRLNDLKNCEYHRAKIKQFLGDYNLCVEENLKLKEANEKLKQQNQSLKTRCEIVQRKLEMLYDGSVPQSPLSTTNDHHFSAKMQSDKQSQKARFISNVDKQKAKPEEKSMGQRLVQALLAKSGVVAANDPEAAKQKQQAETACLKLIEMCKKSRREEEMTFSISREIEALNSIEKVMFVKQVNNLYIIQSGSSTLLWPQSDESVFQQVISTQRLVIVNDLAKDIEIANEIRQATSLKKVYNIMLVPISAGGKKLCPALLLMVNRYAGTPDQPMENRKYIGFNAYQMLVTSKLFQNLLEYGMRYFLNNRVDEEDSQTFRQMLELVDDVMGSTSLHEFQHRTEKCLAKIFHAERVNVMLIHRFKKFFYRIVEDEEGVVAIKTFDISLGLAGFVTVAGHGVLTDYVNQDGRFDKDIDDPKATTTSPALQIISVPVFCAQDSEDP